MKDSHVTQNCTVTVLCSSLSTMPVFAAATTVNGGMYHVQIQVNTIGSQLVITHAKSQRRWHAHGARVGQEASGLHIAEPNAPGGLWHYAFGVAQNSQELQQAKTDAKPQMPRIIQEVKKMRERQTEQTEQEMLIIQEIQNMRKEQVEKDAPGTVDVKEIVTQCKELKKKLRDGGLRDTA